MNKPKRILVGVLLGAATLAAQDSFRGHWSGNIDIPGQTLAVDVDLDKIAKEWVGSISIPAQGASGLPLDPVTLANGKVTFRIKGAPGDPTFAGTLSGDTLSGELTQAGSTFPFKLTRSGDPKVELVKKSPEVAPQFLGKWEGALNAGQSLRLVLNVKNEGGGATATLTSVDQGGGDMPATRVEQKDATLTVVLKAFGAEYHGTINKEGTELTGTWMQGGNDLPLQFKKSTK